MASATERDVMLAQAGAGPVIAVADRPLAGQIEQITGQVFVLKLDGSRVAARNGAQIFEGDIVVTQSGAGATIVSDRAMAALGSDARMLVETGGAQPVFFVLQGQFGMQVLRGAPNTPDHVTVRTPVSSVVLRHGRMLGRAAAEAVSNSFVLLPNIDGSAGVMSVTTAAGGVLLDRPLQGTSVVSLFRSPMPALDRDLASLQGEFSGFLAGWLPTSRPVATSSLLPDTLLAMLGIAGDTLADRGSRLLDLIFPPAAAAAAFEFAPGPSQEQMFVPTVPAAMPQQVPPPTQPPGGGTPNTPLDLSSDFVRGNNTVTGGTAFDMLTVAGDALQANNISIGADAQGRVVLVNGSGSTIQVDNVEELTVNLGVANDVIVLGDLSGTDIADSTVIIHAGAGDDSIDGSLAGKRLVLYGEDGNDTLIGGIKNDDLIGGPGDDVLTGNGGDDLIEGGDGNDLINGGIGNDTASFENAAGPVTVDLKAGTATGQGNDTLTGIEHVYGSAFNDLLTGDDNANRLEGRAGDDTLIGGAGDDTLLGGSGRDQVSFANAAAGVNVSLAAGTASGEGNDALGGLEDVIGSAFNDALTGDGNANLLNGGGGDDTLMGGGGDDTLLGDSGRDQASFANAAAGVTVSLAAGTATGEGSDTLSDIEDVTGSAFGDTLTGNGDANRLDGGGADDTLIGGGGDDTLIGGIGRDQASFANAAAAVTVSLVAGTATGEGSDTLNGIEDVTGSAFGDTLTGDGNANRLDGGSGNDLLIGGAGDDMLIGGSDQDLVSFANAAAGVTVSLATGTATGEGSDVLAEIENVTGSAFGDQLTGDGAANRLDGGDGNDTLLGGGGNDTLIGGNGQDQVSFANAAAGVNVSLAAGTATGEGSDTLSGIEEVTGSAFADQLTGDGNANRLDGGGGNDTLIGGAGDDMLFGGSGQDQVSYASAATGVAVSLAAGTASGAGNDLLSDIEDIIGSAFNDTLTGSDVANTITGSGGDDLIDAMGGDDAVVWQTGDGNDTVAGGSGTDTLIASISGAVDLDRVGGAAVLSGGGSVSMTAMEVARLTGGAGDDSFSLGNLAGVLNSVEILGGNGTDTAIFTNVPGGVDVDLASGTASLNGNVAVSLQSIESVVGSGQRDTLLGGSGNDLLNGGSGNDIIQGRDGNDTLIGGSGNDTLQGDAGIDTVSYSGAGGAVNVDLGAGTASGNGNDSLNTIERVVGSTFADTITGSGGDDTLDGNLGNDLLSGGGGFDMVDYSGATAAIGIDLTQSVQSSTGGYGTDTLSGFEGVIGGAFNDTITGDGNANLLIGGSGNDTLIGNGGLDTLVGGLGADLLTGSAGEAQSFRFSAATEGGDSLTAFESGTDRLQVSGSGFGVAAIVDGQTFFQTALGNPLGVSNAAFIFDSGTGNFAYDSDGDGAAAAVVLATLQSGTVQAADLQVF